MGPGEVFMALIIVGLPVLGIIYIVQRSLRHNERKLELKLEIARATQATNSQQAVRSELEERVRVLEQIVTDRGVETAAQIEALRAAPRLSNVS